LNNFILFLIFFFLVDHESWYPIGRPVGTTIYPGMQITSVFIYNVLKLKFWKSLGLKLAMSLNDVCVFVPVWFGGIATFLAGALAHEVSGSWRAGAAASLVMAVIPAHLMRSVGGGYDNESVAMTAMCLTFFLWCRSLRTPNSWPLGIFAGLAYAYMVAAWGGFIFVGNLVALHAVALVAFGYYSFSLFRAFALFFIVGTSIAVQIPIVNTGPFRSLEQISPFLTFLGLTYVALCDYVGHRQGYTWEKNWTNMLAVRFQVGLFNCFCSE
jgi:dolichyl-diphosphooligosaccharide---protein glycosyltransferase